MSDPYGAFPHHLTNEELKEFQRLRDKAATFPQPNPEQDDDEEAVVETDKV